MKLIILLTVLVTTINLANADAPLVFKTDLTCLEHDGEWCASMYFFDLDRHTRDDPFGYFTFCTENDTKTVTIRTGPLGGDGGVLLRTLQEFYEVGHKVFHTCSMNKTRLCTVNHDFQNVPYRGKKDQLVHHVVTLPGTSYPHYSRHCNVPDCFYDPDYVPYVPPPYPLTKRALDVVSYWTAGNPPNDT